MPRNTLVGFESKSAPEEAYTKDKRLGGSNAN